MNAHQSQYSIQLGKDNSQFKNKYALPKNPIAEEKISINLNWNLADVEGIKFMLSPPKAKKV